MKSKTRKFEILEDRNLLTAYLVEDINTNLASSTFPGEQNGFARAGGVSYFSWLTKDGQQLWQTDMENGANVVDGTQDADEFLFASVGEDSLVYSVCDADDCTLSSTSGAGSVVLKESDGGSIRNLVEFDDVGYFILTKAVEGDATKSVQEVWTTNGTVDGTQLVSATEIGGRISDVSKAGDSVLILEIDNDRNRKVKRYRDGQLSDIVIGDYTSSDVALVSGESLILSKEGSRDFEILDGPDFDSSRMIQPPIPEADQLDARTAFMHNGSIYFLAKANESYSYWRSDGTDAGTKRLKSTQSTILPPQATVSGAYVAVNLWTAENNNSQARLWEIDPATGEFNELFASASGVLRSSESDGVYYEATSGDGTVDLYSVSGDESTLLFADQTPGFKFLGEVEGGLLVASPLTDYSRELLFFDTATKQTRSLAVHDASSADSNPRAKIVVNDFLLFGANFSEIHKFDGVSRSVIASVGVGQTISAGISLDSHGIFLATSFPGLNSGSLQPQLHLWSTDGTSDNTMEIWKDAEASDRAIQLLDPAVTVSAGLLYVPLGDDILISDGTASGTRLLFEETLQAPLSDVQDMVISETPDGVMIAITRDDGKRAVWRTDGSEAGTRQSFVESRFIDTASGLPAGTALPHVVESSGWNLQRDDSVFFLDYGRTLTDLVMDNGDGESQVVQTFEFRTEELVHTSVGLFVIKPGGSEGSPTQLLRIDEEDPTRPAELIAETEDATFRMDWTDVGGTLYFQQMSSNGKTQFWTTDGTAQGTKKALPELERPPSASAAMGETFFFDTYGAEGDQQLWATDGTNSGTLTYSLGESPSALSNSLFHSGYDFAAYKGRLYFTAADRKHGTELWALNDPTPLLGDVDGDNKVAFEDFKILSANFGTGTLRTEGDLNGDGAVTFEDFKQLSTNFGITRNATVPDSLLTISPQALDIVAAAWTVDDSGDDDEQADQF